MNVLGAILVGTVILFFWTGFAQSVLPWGVKSVRSHGEKDGDQPILPSDLPNGMTYTIHGRAAFIAAQPAAYYDIKRYFALEFVTQVVVSVALVLLLAAFPDLDAVQRLGLGALVWLVGFASIDLQYWNWWGFTARYTLGVAVNRLVGYLIMVSLVGALFFA